MVSKSIFGLSVLAFSLFSSAEADAQCFLKKLRSCPLYFQSDPFHCVPQQSWRYVPMAPQIVCDPCPMPVQSNFGYGSYGGQAVCGGGMIVDGGYGGASFPDGGVVYSAPALTSETVVQVIDEETKAEIIRIRQKLNSIQPPTSVPAPNLDEIRGELNQIKGLLESLKPDGDSNNDSSSFKLKQKHAVSLVNYLIAQVQAIESKPRKWNDITGKHSTMGWLIRSDDVSATILKQDGKTCVVPIGKLCDQDQQFVIENASGLRDQSTSKVASR